MDLNLLLPQQILFSLKDLQTIGLLRIATAKKFIRSGEITAIKVGVKLFIAREEIIRYFKAQEVVSGTGGSTVGKLATLGHD